MESKKKKYFGEPLLRLVDQKTDLELMYPESKANIKNGVLTWVGVVKTGPFSKEYTIKIESLGVLFLYISSFALITHINKLMNSEE